MGKKTDTLRSSRSSPMGCILLIAVLLLLYWPTLTHIFEASIEPGSFYSHGFLIPIGCLFIYREKKQRLASLPRSSNRWGIPLLLLGCLLNLFGLLGSVSLASGISLPVVLLALSLSHLGEARTRELLPVFGLILFMIPLPRWFLYQLTFSMKMAAAAAGSAMVKLLGFPVIREGIYIDLPNGISFAIEDPCSGLRTVVSLSAISYILAVLATVAPVKKLLIFISAVPLAWLSNLVRVVITIILVYYAGASAASPLPHILLGVATFLLALLLLILWSNHLLCREKSETSE